MLNTTGQQMLNWTDGTTPAPARDENATQESNGASDVQAIVSQAVTEDDRDGAFSPKACPAPARFHLGFLSREQLIDEIISSNPSATVDFLSDFENRGLRLYLTRLRSAKMGRGRDASSERVAETPAIVAHVRMS